MIIIRSCDNMPVRRLRSADSPDRFADPRQRISSTPSWPISLSHYAAGRRRRNPGEGSLACKQTVRIVSVFT
jgi:hypothetical protein